MKHLLIAAHPGHELLLWQWLRVEHPQVVVLTNGAGSNGVPRLDLTIDNLERAGASWLSQVVAPVPDAAIYQGLLDGDTGLLTQWLEALTAHVIAEGIECIVADEAEDYNPSHDLCRILANQVAIQAKARGHSVLAYGYPTVGHPSLQTRLAAEEHLVVELDVEAWQSKLDDMHRYARHFGGQLQRELDDFVAAFGAEAYSKECLFVARPTRYEQAETPSHKPFFERVGEERVAAGTYQHVIRGAHLQMVADRLRDHASLMRR